MQESYETKNAFKNNIYTSFRIGGDCPQEIWGDQRVIRGDRDELNSISLPLTKPSFVTTTDIIKLHQKAENKNHVHMNIRDWEVDDVLGHRGNKDFRQKLIININR
jgi:hypothetical protein